MISSQEKVACPDSLALPIAPLHSPLASRDERYTKVIPAPSSQSTYLKSLDSHPQNTPWLSKILVSLSTRLLLFLLYDTCMHILLTVLAHLLLLSLPPRPERFETFLARQAALHLAAAAANITLRRGLRAHYFVHHDFSRGIEEKMSALRIGIQEARQEVREIVIANGHCGCHGARMLWDLDLAKFASLSTIESRLNGAESRLVRLDKTIDNHFRCFSYAWERELWEEDYQLQRADVEMCQGMFRPWTEESARGLDE